MHSAVQTAVSDLNFARYTQPYGSYIPSSPLGSISPWYVSVMTFIAWLFTLIDIPWTW